MKKKADGLSPKAFGAPESLGKVSYGSLDERISLDKPVFIVALVDKINLDKLKFKVMILNPDGWWSSSFSH